MTGILLKVASVSVFVTMSTLIKSSAEGMPAGQIVFFRSAFAMVPILIFLALRGQLDSAWQTANPLSHVRRGLVGVTAMGFGFYGIMRLPLPDAIAIGYAMPLLTVVFAALFLGETVRIFRWSAVVVGLGGVLIITWPRLSLFGEGFGSGEGLGRNGRARVGHAWGHRDDPGAQAGADRKDPDHCAVFLADGDGAVACRRCRSAGSCRIGRRWG
jgi:drug/metabolite transporter (DMT)-like permease